MTASLSVLLIIISIILTKLFCITANNTRLMDKPNERSMHIVPTVRGGGLVFIGLFLLGLAVQSYWMNIYPTQQIILFISVLLLALINFMDDLYTLSAKPRFFIQCLVAGAVVLWMRPDTLDFLLFSWFNPYLISVFIFFMVLWAINHFNFMDGLDGFCGGQALFLFVAYALLLNVPGALFYQNMCLILIFGLLGFLCFNVPPARLFMGDVGSATLGFISCAMALIAQQRYDIPIAYWFILNSLFLFDATLTLLRRVLNKEKCFVAHRKHAYQRLKQSGVDTRFILLGQLIVNFSFLCILLLFQKGSVSLSILLFFICFVLLFVYWRIERLFPM